MQLTEEQGLNSVQDQSFLFMILDLHCEHHDLPGIILSQPLKEATVGPRGKEIYLEDEIGASLSISRNSVVKDACLGISASFSGPYDIPDEVKSGIRGYN